jgi:hypothetical protein
MRETCARVLAAALMTGAIATAMGLPTLFESDGDLRRGLTAPPSSLQRSVHAPVLPAPARRPLAERLANAPSNRRPDTRPAIVRTNPRLATVRAPQPQPRPAAADRTTLPKPKPQPEPETRELESTTPPPVQSPEASPAPPAAEDEGRGKNKKGKGGKGKAHGKKTPPAAAEPVEAAPVIETTPPAPEAEPGQDSEAKEHGHGNGHAKGRGPKG